MINYTPKYLKRTIDYRSSEVISSSDYNNNLNLLVMATDNNTDTLEAICNDDSVRLVKNAFHALNATNAVNAADSLLFNGAVLQTSSQSILDSSDQKVPTTKVVRDYVDNLHATTTQSISHLLSRMGTVESKNTIQDNRLDTVDLKLNQYGVRVATLETGLGVSNTRITDNFNKSITQDVTLAKHNERIINLELNNNPGTPADNLMIRANYALPVAGGNYSDTIVNIADSANALNIGGIRVAADDIATANSVSTLSDNSFVNRGAMLDPTNVSYTLAELRALKCGAYHLNSAQASALSLPLVAGTLRIYPGSTGMSLEFEAQTVDYAGYIYNAYIPDTNISTDNLTDTDWTCASQRISVVENAVENLNSATLKVNNLVGGADVSVVTANGVTVVNSTGIKVVVGGSVAPAPDPNRDILWFDLQGVA